MVVTASGDAHATDAAPRVALFISGDAERGEKRTSGRQAARRRLDAQCEATDLLLDSTGGDRHALDPLFSLVYDQLRRVAHEPTQSSLPAQTRVPVIHTPS